MQNVKRRHILISVAISVGALGTAIGVFALLFHTRARPEQIAIDRSVLRVRAATVEARDFLEPIVGYGTARSLRTTNLTAEVAGTLIFRDEAARPGRSVRKGQVLFRIDPRDYEQAVRQLEQMVEAQKALLTQLDLEEDHDKKLLEIVERERQIAADEFTRISGLFAQGLAHKTERDRSDAALLLARRLVEQSTFRLAAIGPRRQILKANLDTAESQLAVARLNLRRCMVCAAFTGQIVDVRAEIGQTVSGGMILAMLLDPAQIEVPVELPAAMRSRIAIGASARIEPQVKRPPLWQGTVARLDGRIDPASRTFRAFVEVSAPLAPSALTPGAFVRVTIDGPTHRSAITIPRAAIRDGHAFVVNAGQAHRRAVRVKRYVGELVLIESGLATGERVILTNLDVLSDGAPVDVAGGTSAGPATTRGTRRP